MLSYVRKPRPLQGSGPPATAGHPRFDGKDATLTIGSMLTEWLGALGGSAAALAGFLLLAAMLLHVRRATGLEHSRARRQLRRQARPQRHHR